MDRISRIPELLRLIFSQLSLSCLPSCTLACRNWSEVALDVVWSDLDDPLPLFRLLAPSDKVLSFCLRSNHPLIPKSSHLRNFDTNVQLGRMIGRLLTGMRVA